MVQVKICGLSTQQTVAAAVNGGAAMIGFVFHPPSPRHIGEQTAADLAAAAGKNVRIAAVTVDASDGQFDGIVKTLNPDVLQLHGRESPDRVADLRRQFGCQVMKAVPVHDADDITAAEKYFPVADMILFDAAPRADGPPGGSGRSFDWTVLSGKTPPIPWMLSGGLTPANVAEAVDVTHAPFVDVSSGVEESPGQKSVQRIAEFMQAAGAAS